MLDSRDVELVMRSNHRPNYVLQVMSELLNRCHGKAQHGQKRDADARQCGCMRAHLQDPHSGGIHTTHVSSAVAVAHHVAVGALEFVRLAHGPRHLSERCSAVLHRASGRADRRVVHVRRHFFLRRWPPDVPPNSAHVMVHPAA